MLTTLRVGWAFFEHGIDVGFVRDEAEIVVAMGGLRVHWRGEEVRMPFVVHSDVFYEGVGNPDSIGLLLSSNEICTEAIMASTASHLCRASSNTATHLDARVVLASLLTA